MKRGRGRRNHNRRARHIWRKTWLLSALAAAAILYGIVELRTGKEKTQDNAQVSAKMPPEQRAWPMTGTAVLGTVGNRNIYRRNGVSGWWM